MPRDYRVYLEDVIEAITKIERYMGDLTFEEFRKNELVIDARAKPRLPPSILSRDVLNKYNLNYSPRINKVHLEKQPHAPHPRRHIWRLFGSYNRPGSRTAHTHAPSHPTETCTRHHT